MEISLFDEPVRLATEDAEGQRYVLSFDDGEVAMFGVTIRMLTDTKIPYRIDGDKIIVMPLLTTGGR